MPKRLERKLKKQARKKFGTTKSRRARRYIYGTMIKLGWRPRKRRKRKKKKKK